MDNSTCINNSAENGVANGLYFTSSSNLTIMGNLVIGNALDGITVSGTGGYNEIINNTAISNTRGMWITTENSTVINNTVEENKIGMDLSYADNTTVIGNKAYNNTQAGFYCDDADYLNFTNNEACYQRGDPSTKSAGIWLIEVNHSFIINNTASNNIGLIDISGIGIYLDDCHNNTLINNTGSDNWGNFTSQIGGIGFCLDNSQNNTLSNNTATGNWGNSTYSGIGFHVNQSDNKCSGFNQSL